MLLRFALTLLFLSTTPLIANPKENLAIQEMRLQCQNLGYQIHSHRVDIEILQEKVLSLNSTLESLRQEMGSHQKMGGDLVTNRLSQIEKKIKNLEKNHETVLGDLKTLKNHLNDSTQALTKCQQKLTDLDKQLTCDIKSLKHSLQSMLTLLQKGEVGEQKTYTVQSGDSLGKIAQDFHTTIKRLKEYNQLTSDQIIIGQKLQIPE